MEWRRNPLELKVGRGGVFPETKLVDNVVSYDSAQATIGRLNALELSQINPTDFWRRRAELFPHLLFGMDIAGQIRAIGLDLFRSAITRLLELNKSAEIWKSKRCRYPTYLSKVTGESSATMEKYGIERQFRSSSGAVAVFEKHARLANGGRLHLRELPERTIIEIGYIGRHLRIVSTD